MAEGRSIQIVISTLQGDIYNFQVDATETIENIKALIEVEVIFTLFGSNYYCRHTSQ